MKSERMTRVLMWPPREAGRQVACRRGGRVVVEASAVQRATDGETDRMFRCVTLLIREPASSALSPFAMVPDDS